MLLVHGAKNWAGRVLYGCIIDASCIVFLKNSETLLKLYDITLSGEPPVLGIG